MNKEIDLLDIFTILKEGKTWVLLSAAIGMLGGGAYASLTPVKYEATASIQMATVAGVPVELPNVLVEKLKLPLYYSNTTISSCGLKESPVAGRELVNALKPIVNKNAPFIAISFRSNSAGEATKCIESALDDIRKNQNILAKPIVDTKKTQLNMLQQKLEADEKLTRLFPIEKLKFDFNDAKFSAAALLTLTLTSKENEMRDLRNQINDLQVALKAPQTMETRLTTPIYAPDAGIKSNKLVIMLLASLAGGMLASIFLVLRKAWIKP